jgi:hypothetical protein
VRVAALDAEVRELRALQLRDSDVFEFGRHRGGKLSPAERLAEIERVGR